MGGLLFAVAVVVGCVAGSVSANGAGNCTTPSDRILRSDFILSTREGTTDVGNAEFVAYAAPRARHARAVIRRINSEHFTPVSLDLSFDNVKEIRIHFVSVSAEGRNKRTLVYNAIGLATMNLTWNESETESVKLVVVNAVPASRTNNVMLSIDQVAACKLSTNMVSTSHTATTAMATTTAGLGLEYKGCYNLGVQVGRLFHDNNTMTLEKCAEFCSGTYIGITKGTACYCPPASAAADSFKVSPVACSITCAGNSQQMCGGLSALSFYATVG